MKKKLLKNKVAIITGANQGLGYKIAIKFINSECNLILCSRNIDLLKKKFNNIILENNIQKIILIKADISKISDVKKVYKIAKTKFKKIDILINNAGIIGPKGEFEKIDIKKWKETIDINLIGSILMIKEIIPFFKKQKHGKIVQLSGGGSTNPFPYFSAYSSSKTAIVRFIENISIELKNYNVDANSISPGALNTQMLEDVLSAGQKKVGKENYQKLIKQKKEGDASFDKATALIEFLSSDLSNGISGKLISAIWDNWKDWPKYKSRINNSDLYTIRRITGEDRNFKKGDN